MDIIKFSKSELSIALQPILSVVERRNALPILLNVLITFRKNIVSFTTSDIEVQITSTLIKDNLELEDLELTVSARKLFEISKSLSDHKTIVLSLIKDKLVIQQEQSKFSLQTLPAKDFPLLDIGNKTNLSFSLQSDEMKTLLDSVSFSMAIQDVRYYLNGLFLQVNGKELIAVTTDGHRLCFNKITIPSLDNSTESMSCIVPRKAVIELQKVLSTTKDIKDKNVEISIHSNYIQLCLPGKRLISKLIEGNYPDYQKVIPNDSKYKVMFNKKDFLEKLTRVSILTSDKYRGIRITLDGETAVLQSTNSDQEEAIEKIITEEGSGELDIGFNVTYLVEVLNNINADKVGFSFNDSQSSAVITNLEDKEFKYIVMPMRL
ncbi:DNA polymerase III subunit beta [Betaproteobacteria bacterium]|nr:DNA polymerase III subunit beta [Betaproteobacteria bacterium]